MNCHKKIMSSKKVKGKLNICSCAVVSLGRAVRFADGTKEGEGNHL